VDAERVFAGLPKKYDTIVNISPGTTKSTILSVMAPAWIHARNPTMRVLCASYTYNLTRELGRKCKLVEESELYQRLFPHVVPDKTQWNSGTFLNKAGGGRYSATVGGMSPTGFHAHFLLVDDPMDPQQARRIQVSELGAANIFMSEVLPTRKVDKAVAVTWLIMQRLHQDDPSGHLLERWKGKVRHICLPAELSQKVKPVKLRKKYVQGLMDPQRLSQKVLEEAKIDLGSYGYSGQYGQSPTPKKGGMFKIGLITVDNPPPLSSKQWVSLCRFWDKAGTKDGGAYTVGFLMGRWRPAGGAKDGADDEWWILGIEREQFDSAERERLIVSTANRDGKRVTIGIEQEPGSGGKESAQASVKRLAGYRVRIVRAVGSKEDRADEWSTMINAGNFKMARADWNAILLDELQNFPRSKYKDQVDSGAGAYTVLANPETMVGGV